MTLPNRRPPRWRGVREWRLLLLLTAWIVAPGSRAQSDPAPAQADAIPPAAAIGQIGYGEDSDDFHGFRVRAGALVGYRSWLDYAGIAAQTTHYSQSGWSRNVQGVVGYYRDQKRDTLAGANVEAGLVRVSGHTRVIGDATWSFRPREGTGVELIAAADLVETRPAIERGIAYSLWGASLEQAFGDRLTVIGMAAWQPFTDGNDRTVLRARLLWLALPEHGLSLQVRWRGYRSSEEDVGGAYFNPERYHQADGGLTFRKRHAGWIWSGTLAAGREWIESDTSKATFFAEARGEGPLARDVHLSAFVLFSRSAAFQDTPDYRYALLGATLIFPFR